MATNALGSEVEIAIAYQNSRSVGSTIEPTIDFAKTRVAGALLEALVDFPRSNAASSAELELILVILHKGEILVGGMIHGEDATGALVSGEGT